MEDVQKVLQKIHSIIERDARYKIEAYSFVLGALNDTVRKLEQPRHVTGRELCEGIRLYALEQFGPLTITVLDYWGIHETLDFGRIVFTLVDAGLMSKTENDSLDDFKDVYDFKKAFEQGKRIDSK